MVTTTRVSGVSSTGFAAPGTFPAEHRPGQSPKYTDTDYNGYSRVAIPVTRWVDSLLEPGKKIKANGSTVTLPDIKMMVFGGNNRGTTTKIATRCVKHSRAYKL